MLTVSGGYHVLACYCLSTANELLFDFFKICMLVHGFVFVLLFFAMYFPRILKLAFLSMISQLGLLSMEHKIDNSDILWIIVERYFKIIRKLF